MFLVRLPGGRESPYQVVKHADGSVTIKRRMRSNRDEVDMSFRKASISQNSRKSIEGGSLYDRQSRASMSPSRSGSIDFAAASFKKGLPVMNWLLMSYVTYAEGSEYSRTVSGDAVSIMSGPRGFGSVSLAAPTFDSPGVLCGQYFASMTWHDFRALVANVGAVCRGAGGLPRSVHSVRHVSRPAHTSHH